MPRKKRVNEPMKKNMIVILFQEYDRYELKL